MLADLLGSGRIDAVKRKTDESISRPRDSIRRLKREKWSEGVGWFSQLVETQEGVVICPIPCTNKVRDEN